MSAPTITPEQRAARRLGKLDQTCLEPTCGATSAASSRCFACLSTNVRYQMHSDNGGQCVMGGGAGGRRFAKSPDSALSDGKTTDAPPAALSAAGLSLWGES